MQTFEFNLSQKNVINQIQFKEEIKQENEELKERIRHGALEYTKLFEKNRLLKNQKFNSEVNVYHDLTSDDEHITGRILSRGMQFNGSQINSVHTADERGTTIQVISILPPSGRCAKKNNFHF